MTARLPFLLIILAMGAACVPAAPPSAPTTPATAQPRATGQPVTAAATASQFQQLLEAVRAEPAKLVVVDTRPTDPGAQKTIADAFNKRFGLNVSIEWIIEHNIPQFPKFITELKAGRQAPDVETWDTYQVPIANREVPGTYKQFDWVGVFSEALPDIVRYVDHVPVPEVRGLALASTDLLYSIAYNTKLISKGDVPTSFEDLAQPQWKGKFGVQSVSAAPFQVLALKQGWGPEKTDQVLGALMANQPFLKQGSPALLDALGRGEVPVAIGSLPTVYSLQQDGAPVDFRAIPLVPELQQVIAVTEGPQQKSVNTARLFAAWLVVEGKQFMWREGKGVTADKDWPVLRALLADNPNVQFVSATTLEDYTAMEQLNTTLYKKYYPGA
jgi:iron(III) transport system substrate-binding protein